MVIAILKIFALRKTYSAVSFMFFGKYAAHTFQINLAEILVFNFSFRRNIITINITETFFAIPKTKGARDVRRREISKTYF